MILTIEKWCRRFIELVNLKEYLKQFANKKISKELDDAISEVIRTERDKRQTVN